jgi:hypothetical protein
LRCARDRKPSYWNAGTHVRTAFVNFTQISFAIKALEAIKQDPDYQNLKVA